ncbi:MAG: catalase-peroxidase, partial [Cyanobacteria bacterium]|nr:catalase-peroxidase [Cyanobacteriota bacterium]
RYLGADSPNGVVIWQDPLPPADPNPINAEDIAQLKTQILNSGLTIPEMVSTAWASAASFRGTDYRGGANGARIRLEPQIHWAVNNPEELAKVLNRLEKIQKNFNNGKFSNRKVSLADLIVLAGDTAIELAAKKAGLEIQVPFAPGRVDASQANTDVKSFAMLEPKADGFRNYFNPSENTLSPAEMLVERASLLTLTVPEMTVLVGGMRSLDANTAHTHHGVLTQRPGTLSNDFFVNLLDMSTKWEKSPKVEGHYDGYDRKTGKLKWTASPVDLVFGSNSELRAVAEVYASEDGQKQFVEDFARAWNKVMNLDRF